MTIRILHVVRQYLPSVGGMEEVIRNIARHQLEAGHLPAIVTLDQLFRDRGRRLPTNERIEGVPVRRLAFTGSSRYPLCPQVLGLLGEADLIHVHGIDFFFDYLAATRWLHRRPLVASTHGGFFHTRFAARLKRLFFHTVTRGSARAYERIIATSDNDGRIFEPVVGRDRLRVIENGVDVRKFRDRAPHGATPTLIYFGRWSENKGLPEALDLLAALRAADSAWRLIIAGREYDYDAAHLAALATEKAVADAVEILPNPDDAALAAAIARASYFVCLSRHEGFGLAAIEAMSAGLVPVLSDIPPFRALVERSGLGFLVGPGDSRVAAGRLLRDRHLPADLHGARRERAVAFAEPYDWQRVAGSYERVYQEVERR